jgi:hypothetical protein
MSTELFATAKRTHLAFRNMLSSYVQTARRKGAPPTVSRTKMTGFMDKVLTSEQQQKIYVPSHGKLQMSDGKVIQLVAYDD